MADINSLVDQLSELTAGFEERYLRRALKKSRGHVGRCAKLSGLSRRSVTEKIAQYGTDKVIDFFLGLQVWGTPEQCYARILDIRERVSNQAFVGVFSYAGMPYDEAERNMRLFAREVTPELRKLSEASAPARTHGERARPQADIALGF